MGRLQTKEHSSAGPGRGLLDGASVVGSAGCGGHPHGRQPQAWRLVVNLPGSSGARRPGATSLSPCAFAKSVRAQEMQEMAVDPDRRE